MGSTHPPRIEDPEEVELDESILLTPTQIKAMSKEELQAHLERLNILRSTPKQPRKAKVTETGERAPTRGRREVL
jgi:hypothetical protein